MHQLLQMAHKTIAQQHWCRPGQEVQGTHSPGSISLCPLCCLQAHAGQPRYMAALTAVLLQAGIADPDLVQALLADHDCWPALLTLCTPQLSTPAEKHAQRLSRLSPHAGLLTPGSADVGCASRQQEVPPRGRSEGKADTILEPGCGGDNTTQQSPCDPADAAGTGVSSRWQSDKLLWAHHMQHTASAASHVAQLITSFVQSQPEAGAPPGKHTGMDSLVALLQCYAMWAETAARPMCAPVWPPQAQLQRHQHAMLEHVAQAGMQRVCIARCCWRDSAKL